MDEVIINGIAYIKKDTAIDTDYVLVRCDRSGVFIGNIEKEEGNTATLKNARRVWYWSGAASLSQLAVEGTKKPNDCKFPMAVPEIRLKDVIEVIPCSEEARKSLQGVKVWSA